MWSILFWVLVFTTGACVGSFLNVCIYRLPLGKSVWRARSQCAACGTGIPWRYNIPILGWFILRGRSACCATKIDFRYVVVEGLTAVGFAGLFWKYPPTLAAVYALLLSLLIVATFVDVDHFIIPDEISLGGWVLGICLSAWIPALHHAPSHFSGFKHALVGSVFGGGLLLAVAILGALILRKEAMGMGDIKLMAMMGAFLGWRAPIFILTVASFMGSAGGIFLLLRKQKLWGVRMPFGPYLALAGVIWLFGGREWMAEYLKTLF